MKKVDLVGEKFGRWTVMSKAKNKGKNTAWNCLCECGTERSVLTHNLTRGKSSSCGCGQKEAASKANTTHGKRNTKLYGVYSGMKQRCYNENSPAYEYYGGKGVYICKEWLDDFMNFYNWAKANGYGKDMSIDRIDPNGNYEPDNCRWVTMEKQQNNKLNSMFIIIGNEKKTISEWAKTRKTNQQTLYSKIYRLLEQLGIDNEDVKEFEIKL